MLAIRTSAAIALLFVLLGVAGVVVPLFYKQPPRTHIGVDDIAFVIAYGSLFAGAFLVFIRSYSTVLTAAWSWALALQTSLLGQRIAHSSDYRALLSKFGDHGAMQNTLEQASHRDLQIGMFYMAVTVVALILVIGGDLTVRAARRHHSS